MDHFYDGNRNVCQHNNPDYSVHRHRDFDAYLHTPFNCNRDRDSHSNNHVPGHIYPAAATHGDLDSRSIHRDRNKY